MRHKIEFKASNIKYKIFEVVNKKTNERFIEITQNKRPVVNKKSLLNPSIVEGYATNFIRRTKQGFYYSFEFGNRHHYEYEFHFKLIKNDYFLYKVKKSYVDMANPSSSKVSIIPVNAIKFTSYDVSNYTK